MKTTTKAAIVLDRVARALVVWCDAHPGEALPANMANAAQLLRHWTAEDWAKAIAADRPQGGRR